MTHGKWLSLLLGLLVVPAWASPASACAPVAPAKGREFTARQADVLVMGDSIAAGLPLKALERAFPGMSIDKIATAGERAQQTLWKVDQIADLRPQYVVLIVGTNNLGRSAPCSTAATIVELVKRIQKLGPKAIYVFAILPRGDRGDERLTVNTEVAAALAGRHGVRLINLEQELQACPSCYREDRLHLSKRGYEVLAGGMAGASKSKLEWRDSQDR